MAHEDKVAHVYKQGQWHASHQDGCKTSGSSIPNGNNGSENSLHQALHMPAVEYAYLCSVLQYGMDPQQTRSRSVCAWEVSWGWENLLIFILLTDFSPLFTSAHSTPASLSPCFSCGTLQLSHRHQHISAGSFCTSLKPSSQGPSNLWQQDA